MKNIRKEHIMKCTKESMEKAMYTLYQDRHLDAWDDLNRAVNSLEKVRKQYHDNIYLDDIEDTSPATNCTKSTA